MCRSLRVVGVALITILSVGIAHGQQIQVFGGPMERQNRVTQKQQFQQQIAVVIEDMKRACKLSDEQVKKLELASKGAVQSALEKHKRQMKKLQGMPGIGEFIEEVEEDEDDEGNEDKDADGDVVVPQPNAMIRRLVVNGMGGGFGGSTGAIRVDREPLWKKNVGKVLSDEQQAAYKKALAERKAFRRSAAVASFVSKADQKLLLTAAQRDSLSKVIDKEFGEKLANRTNQSGNVFFFAAGGAGQAAPIEHSRLAFLSASQLGEWKQFESELNGLRNQQFGGGAAGGFFMGGAAGPANVIINRGAAPIRIQADGGVIQVKEDDDK